MNIIFIYGPVASGKLTIARSLSDEIELPLFHNHLTVDLVSSLFEFGSPEFISLREKIWLLSFQTAVRSGQSFIFTFTPDKTVNEDFIDNLYSIVSMNSNKIIFIELVCEEDEIENRIENKNRSEYGKLNSVELYRQLRSDGAFDSKFALDPDLSINTKKNSVIESVNLIKNHLLNMA
jgi:deoxyadenosine/deoxycytidine kinase